jgi:hypothetical protein
MEEIARHYWGEPNPKARGQKLRWGTHNGREVDLRKGVWFDYELNKGGGVIDMVRHHEGASLKPIHEILEHKFGITREVEERIRPKEWLSKVYEYYDEDGVLSYQVLRYEPKRFIQRHPDDKGGWVWNMDGVTPLPYNLPLIVGQPDRPILVVEGEKCADALVSAGFLATTSHGGARKWREDLNRWFDGRAVVMIADNDEAGEAHMDMVAQNLNGVAARMKRVVLPNLAPKGDVADWLAANGNDADRLKHIMRSTPLYEVPDDLPEVEQSVDEAEDEQADTFEIYTLEHLRRMPPVEWLIDGMLTKHGFSVLYGEPGAGKSFLALDWALSIAHGRAWQGRHNVTAGSVLYIAGEGVGGLGKRIKGWEFHHELPGVDCPFYVLPTAVRFREHGDIEKLMRTIDSLGQRFSLIVIDTVARALLGGDENSATDMGMFVDACDAIKRHAGCAVLAVHHSGKDAARGMRGSTSLLGGVDASLRAMQDDGLMTIQVEKQKDAEPAGDIGLRMVSVGLIGDQTVVLHETDEQGTPKQRRERLTGPQKIALQSLTNLAATKGPKVSVASWHEEHNGKTPSATRQSRNRARDALQNKGIVVIDKGLAWVDYDVLKGGDGEV